MSSLRLRRVVSVASSALLALMLIGPAATSAAQAGWTFTSPNHPQPVMLPSTVSPGQAAGYRFTLSNDGTSNISQLYLTASVNQPVAYLAGDRQGLCQLSPVLYCAFGALNAGDSLTLTIAYITPSSGSSFAVTFQANSTGNTFTDKGKNSHGDTLDLPFSTTLSADPDFAGGFNTVDGTYELANSGVLGRRNIQATGALVTQGFIPVTVKDGPTNTSACVGCTKTLFGEWSTVEVAEGSPVSGGITVTMTLYSKNVPAKLDPATVVVYHTYVVGTTTVTDMVTSTTDVATVGRITSAAFDANKNLVVVLTVPHNGNIRFGY